MICSLVRVDNGQPFVDSADMIPNSDGSVSFKLPNGLYAGQEPNQYGVRCIDIDEPKQYQRATLLGSTVTFLTRDGDLPCIYLCGQGKVYPS